MLNVQLAVLLLARRKDRAGLLFFTIALLPAPSICRSGCYASLQRLALFAAHVVSQATMPAPAQQLLSRILFSGQTQQILLLILLQGPQPGVATVSNQGITDAHALSCL